MSSTISNEDRLAIWNLWLCGDSLGEIVRYGPSSNAAKVKAILEGAVPDEVLGDPRYVHSGRFFWVSVSKPFPNERSDGLDAFVVVKQPRKNTKDVFVKAIRAIRREVRGLGGDLDLQVMEGDGDRETDEAYLRMVEKRGYLAFEFDGEGNVSRFDPSEVSLDASSETGVPSP